MERNQENEKAKMVDGGDQSTLKHDNDEKISYETPTLTVLGDVSKLTNYDVSVGV